jgi:hypothetical protein
MKSQKRSFKDIIVITVFAFGARLFLHHNGWRCVKKDGPTKNQWEKEFEVLDMDKPFRDGHRPTKKTTLVVSWKQALFRQLKIQ